MNRKPDETMLLSVDGVVSVKNTEGICYRVAIENKKGITEELIHLAVNQGWGLQEIHYEKKSLDDVFIRLTKPAWRSISESNQQ
jgi:ABC-2 type transport system ATP-binding protein